MNLETIPFVELIISIFLLGYWVGIFILLYHLIRFGVGAHPRIIALALLLGSLLLTGFGVTLLLQIK
ncbi:MAG: hypothetical protein RJB39_509 [Candidatus Parcubacteria bacterium]|jgi:Na+/H+ antiporter NhaA